MNAILHSSLTQRKLRFLVILAVLVWSAARVLTAATIVDVVETGGDNEATDTILPKWTGITWNTTVANEPILNTPVGTPYTVPSFGQNVPCYVDRAHAWVGASGSISIPSYLLGQEYIMEGNDNRDNTSLTLDITVNVPVQVYLLVDNRMPNGKANATPPVFGPGAMQWVLDDGWVGVTNGLNRDGTPTRPDEVGVDESADGTINQWSSIYTKAFPAGTFQLKQADNPGRNMYGVVVVPLEVTEPPAVPTGLTEFSQDSRVTLRWVPSAGATEYLVKRSEVSGGPYTVVATGNFLTHADDTVVNGTTYYYVVSARNPAGESADSAEVAAHPNIAPVVVATGGTNQVLLTWGGLAGATSYTVLRSGTNGGPYAVIASGLTALEYLDAPLPAGQPFYYLVSAVLGGGISSGFSAEVSAVTAPSPLTNSYAELFALTVAKIAFRTPDVVAPTVAIEKSSDGVVWTPITTLTTNAGYTLDPGLVPSTVVQYRLQASNPSGVSPYAVYTLDVPATGYNVNIANVSNSTSTVTAPTPPGHVQDVGLVFGDRGNGFSYGWDRDITTDGRYRRNANSPDLRYDTFNHLQKATPSAIWEMAIPNGLYWVRFAAGESDNFDSTFQFSVEGLLTRVVPATTANRWAEFTNTVHVSDGRLTITSGSNAANNKLDFVAIYPTAPAPNILVSNPVSLVLTQNRSATFTVVIGGGPEPYGVQWYLNGNPIDGATGPSFTIPFVQTSDEGDYHAVITNASVVVDPSTTVTSTSAHLTVIPDTEGPKIVSVGSLDGYTIGVRFDEIVDTNGLNPPALDNFTYSINEGAVAVATVVLRPDQRSVQLILESISVPITGEFTVTASGVTDLAGNGSNDASSGTNTVMGLTARDIGAPAFTGANYVNDSETIELVGGGADVWGTADQFYFASKAVTGDFDARMQVADLRGSNTITKALLMARADDTAGSPSLHLSVNPTPPGRNQFEPGQRLTPDGATASWGTTFIPADIPNCWLRLTRSGDTFRGYRSANGEDWVLMAESNQVFGASLHVGIGVTAHDNTQLATGTFQGFTVTPLVTPPAQPRLVNPGYSGGTFSFGIVTESGHNYQVFFKNQLADPDWTLLTDVPGTGGVVPITDSSPTPGTRFYRVIAQ